MKTEHALQTGTAGRQVETQQGQGDTTITGTGQSRQTRLILVLLVSGLALIGGLMGWTGRGGEGNAVVDSQAQGVRPVVEAASGLWFPPQAQAYLPRAETSAQTELTAANFPPQAHGSLPRGMRGLSAELTAADFPPQAHGYLPPSIRDAGTVQAGCEANTLPPQAQAYLPCQRTNR